ncbi:MAG TPA: hypothetical protein VN704_05930 [Verrucomicrobiae bacterium]|nr:hypothetical protein [Verrucomicrobiae bacterium]
METVTTSLPNNSNIKNNDNSLSTNTKKFFDQTSIVNINKTISNTTAYPIFSEFLAKHNASELPVPSAARMFTPDKAGIIRVYQNPYILEIVHLPKKLVAGQTSDFILNNIDKNGTWLWHSDYDIFVRNEKSGQTVLTLPSIHGHGSMIRFSYVFPSPGTYNIGIVYGQQVMPPNYIHPRYVKEDNFSVNVYPSNQVIVKEVETKSGINSIKNDNALSSLSPPLTSNPQDAVINTMESNVNNSSQNNNNNHVNNNIINTNNSDTSIVTNQTNHHIKDITINVKPWAYTPNKKVNKGDLVRLHFVTSNDEVSLYNGHGFGIDGYNINIFLLKGTQQTLQFIADKAGTFTFRCTSFCALPNADQMNHFNMIGSFIVHA